MRTDLLLISEWIKPGSHVLDLGCGDGKLLACLRDTKQVSGYGLEIDDGHLLSCIKAGVHVIQTDLNRGLADFNDNSFDYVVMSQTLQAMDKPDKLLDEMLRVGREGIVTFPNFGHWRARLQLGLGGHMPLSGALPEQWYETPNVHLCTMRDFENLCRNKHIEILQRAAVDLRHHSTWSMRLLPNLFGENALYRCRRKD